MEIFLSTDGPAVHWLMGAYGVTPCGIPSTAPGVPPVADEALKVSCARCLEFVLQTEPTGIYKCPHCPRLWTTEEYRDLHAFSHD